MTPIILAALMAATAPDSCYITKDPASGAQVLVCGDIMTWLGPEHGVARDAIPKPPQPDTIGYWLNNTDTVWVIKKGR